MDKKLFLFTLVTTLALGSGTQAQENETCIRPTGGYIMSCFPCAVAMTYSSELKRNRCHFRCECKKTNGEMNFTFHLFLPNTALSLKNVNGELVEEVNHQHEKKDTK